MFDRLWKRLRSEPNPEKGEHDDRRAHQRHPTNLETTCRPVNGSDESASILVRDVSSGGIKFHIDRKLEPGTLIRIDLPPANGAESTMLACVMHATLQTDGTFAIGCAFSDELGEAELHHLGGRREPAHGPDKRAWMRFPAHGFAEYIVLPPRESPTKRAEISNISPTGIGLLLDEKVEPGLILDLLLKTTSGEQTFDILACVVFLGKRLEGGWVAGCHFIRELEDRDLKRLV